MNFSCYEKLIANAVIISTYDVNYPELWGSQIAPGLAAGLMHVSDSMTNADIRIPGYRILREIGRGGIATVYLAVQESLEREVALKVMSPVLVAEPNFTERFIAEGRTIAQLNHPGIVTIYDVAAENFYTYIAMEYLPGGSLRERLQQKMSEKVVLGIIYQMADALACAHDSGIVHRDVKPENIMFRANGSPVLTDFGIAKTVGSDARLTQSGIIVGTPRYISPEQADGRGTDPRSDLYALGVILYEMLAGKPPFGKGKDDSISLLYSHVHDPIPDLPEKHRHLQYLVDATMAKDPNKRVSDCHRLADMIRVIRREVRRSGTSVLVDEPAAIAEDSKGSVSAIVSKSLKKKSGTSWRLFVGGLGGLSAILLLAAILADGTSWFSTEEDATTTSDASRDVELPLPRPLLVTPQSPQTETTPDTETSAMAETSLGAVEGGSPDDPDTPQRESTTVAAGASPEAAPGAQTADTSGGDATRDSEARGPVEVKTPTPATEIAAADRKSAKSTQPRQRRLALQSMLRLAEKQVQLGQLDAPEGDNALDTYRRILSNDKKNARAKAGLKEIADYFLDRSRESAEAKDYQRAQAFVARGLEAVPEHENLRGFQTEMKLRLEAEQEFAKAEDHYWGRNAERDLAAAVRYYRKAAEQGHILAQYYLGIAYADGTGTSLDEAEGLRWLRRAAVQGNEDAQFNLALGLIFGSDPDPAEAADLMTTLAERNYEPAFKILGWMFSTGTGVKQSIKEAIRWDFKDAVTESPEGALFPERAVNSWRRLLNTAIQKTKQEQKPQEPG